MDVEIVLPDEYLGEVVNQMKSRRGEIQGIDNRPGNSQAVNAIVPLAEMFGYATELRSGTKGRGVFTMEFERYEKVEESVQRRITGR
jgi:elongation factor G